MARCAAIKANGERCRLDAKGKQSMCWAHAPENAVARRKRASRGGKAKANQELPSIKARLEDLTEQVLAGDLETGRAAVANQLINTRLRAIELERKIREAEEIEERLEALENDLGDSGGSRWGA
jgi:archaellum component FlaC